MSATHIRRKNKVKVAVERFEGNVLVVRNLKGKVLGSYGPDQEFEMKKFYQRYESISPHHKKRG